MWQVFWPLLKMLPAFFFEVSDSDKHLLYTVQIGGRHIVVFPCRHGNWHVNWWRWLQWYSSWSWWRFFNSDTNDDVDDDDKDLKVMSNYLDAIHVENLVTANILVLLLSNSRNQDLRLCLCFNFSFWSISHAASLLYGNAAVLSVRPLIHLHSTWMDVLETNERFHWNDKNLKFFLSLWLLI